mmetsp:Transcript_124430/g.285142  ORF Transcript_124430/g.285142 Transcript_124430/m.285142 type:complete len:133 (+) Transcript_124430:1-399(+)
MRVPIAVASVACALNSSTTGSSCTLPAWPGTRHCTTADLDGMAESCPGLEEEETQKAFSACAEDCGSPGSEACVEQCYEVKCPGLRYGCRSCHAMYFACLQCVLARGQGSMKDECTKPFQVCIGVSTPAFMV